MVVSNHEHNRSIEMRALFKKREDVFIRLIHDQAALTLDGLEALKLYFDNHDPATAKLLTAKEKEADEARRILIDELNRTFVTPIDREDIFKLSRAIDDVIDYAYSTVDEMQILEGEASEYVQKMASVLREAAEELELAVRYLRGRPSIANDHAVRAKALENQAEALY